MPPERCLGDSFQTSGGPATVRPFSFASEPAGGSFRGVNRRLFRAFLLALLLGSSAFVVWSWFRPYDRSADPAARYRIHAAELTSDHSYFWLTLHLKRAGEADHDLTAPVRMETGGGRSLEPADITFAGSEDTGVGEMWFRFWLEKDDFGGPMRLQLNEGMLVVRTGDGVPALGGSGRRVFTTNHW